jgi:hypothetical protein
LTSTTPLRGSRFTLFALALIAASTLALAWSASSAQAFSNANDADCYGHLKAGTAAPGDTDTQVRYTFGCSTPFLGYQIQAQVPITNFDSSTIAIGGDGQPVAADFFNCNGFFPGIAFNCIGNYTGTLLNNKFEQVVGQFAIGTKLCDEPRVDPLLTIVQATANKTTGVVTQSIAGPFDLGRPQGCPKSAHSGDARIGPEGVPVDKAAERAAARAKAKAKADKAKKKHHAKKKTKKVNKVAAL